MLVGFPRPIIGKKGFIINKTMIVGQGANTSSPLLYRTDSGATTWTNASSSIDVTGNTIYSIAYGNGMYVMGATNGRMYYSSDGITWTMNNIGLGAGTYNSIVFANGIFVMVGAIGDIYTSSNGISWTKRTHSVGTTLFNKVVYGKGLFVAAGGGGVIITSPDGITWTARTSNFSSYEILDLAVGEGDDTFFVAVGRGNSNGTAGIISTSPDGITWTHRNNGHARLLNGRMERCGVIGNSALIFGPDINGLYAYSTSIDAGSTWQTPTTPATGYPYPALAAGHFSRFHVYNSELYFAPMGVTGFNPTKGTVTYYKTINGNIRNWETFGSTSPEITANYVNDFVFGP